MMGQEAAMPLQLDTAPRRHDDRAGLPPLARASRLVLLRAMNESGASSEAVAARLRTAIDLGFFTDGEPLPKEALLAKQLEVTTFALREALAQLRSEGLVSTRAGRGGGTFVRRVPEHLRIISQTRLRELSAVVLRDLGDWRAMLVGESAELAAQRASEANFARLHAYAQRLQEAESPLAGRRAHARFHVELAAAGQSLRMSAAELELHEEFGWLFALPLEDEEFRSREAGRLASIIRAVENRDGDQARKLARGTVQASMDVLVRLRLELIAKKEEEAL